MNGTPRGLNRVLLGALGLVLIGTGILAVWSGTSTEFARNLTSDTSAAWAGGQDQLAAARIPGTDTSWWTVVLVAVLLLCAGLLVAWISAQGTGRSNQLARRNDENGTTTVDAAVAAQMIKTALAANPQILATSVQAWGSKAAADGAGLKITLQCRKGASPAEVGSAVEHQVELLDQLLGTRVPVLIRIKAGTRTRISRTERVA